MITTQAAAGCERTAERLLRSTAARSYDPEFGWSGMHWWRKSFLVR